MGNRFETQDRLIAAAREIILDEGVEACSLEKICSRAGFTRGAFYSNFSTKDSLFVALAEEEYGRLINALEDTVRTWRDRGVARDGAAPDAPATQAASAAPQAVKIEDLLFEALDAMGFDRALYVIHSELLIRSIQDAQWGARLLDINNAFIDELATVLAAIFRAARREPTQPMRALSHAIIAIAMRAAGLDAWRSAVRALPRRGASAAPGEDPRAGLTAEEHPGSVANSPARDVVQMITLLLHAASRPMANEPTSKPAYPPRNDDRNRRGGMSTRRQNIHRCI